MDKKSIKLFLICLVISISIFSSSLASDLKVKSMAQMSLIIQDNDNQLNLYDFGLNPAWLVKDQQQSWLRPFFTTYRHSGGFRRIYDPETFIDFNASFEGIKIMDEHQTFRGLVDYHNMNLNDVYQSISRNPYQEHPFRLADNTTGSIHYWGPTVSAQYSRSVYAEKLFWGASLDYQIETGLKDFFPQPRTIYRYVALGTGFACGVSDRLSIGTTFNYSHTQEFTEAVPPSSNDPRVILVMKFRGEDIGSERVDNMERFTKTKIFKWGFQTHYKLFDYFESALLFYYNIQNLDATESRIVPVKDGTWKLHGYEIHWKNRFKLPNLPFRLGLSFDHIYFNDWAVHPRFDVLVGDDYISENRIGIGVAFEPFSLPFILGIEHHTRFAKKDKKDYVSQLIASGDIDGNNLKIGTEMGITENWKVRAGYIYQHNDVAPALLSFSEYLAENKSHCFTFGLAHFLKSADIEIYGYYGQQTPTVNQNALRRDRLGCVVSMKFYRD